MAAYELLLLNTAIPQIQAAQSGDTYVVPRDIAFNAGVNVVNNDVTIYGVTVGRGAGAGATNTAVGASALAANTTGTDSTAVGRLALSANTTGSYNAAFGAGALYVNTTGSQNTALGVNALVANTSGASNVAVGMQALQANTTASNNTAVGYQAGYTNQTGLDNVYLGWKAGFAHTGAESTFLGDYAGFNTTGNNNTFVGRGAGFLITTGTKNIVIGVYNGNQGGLDIRTASNYIVLSDGDGNPRGWWDNSGIFYANPTRIRIDGNSMYDSNSAGNDTGIAFGTGGILPTNGFGAAVDNTKDLGSGTYRMRVIYAGTGTINTSDANTKQDISDLDDAEKRVAVRIKSLIKKFRFKDAVAEKGDAARIHVGVIAQEVQAAFVAEGLDPTQYALFCSDTWYEVDGKASVDAPYTADTPNAVAVTRLGIRYDELLAFVIAAI